MGFLIPNNAVGLDIDTAEIRAVELSGKAESPRLVRFGRTPLPGGAVREGMIVDPGMVEDALHNLWSDIGFSSREVILGVSNQGVLVRFATFPKVADKKMDKLIKFQAQEYIPYPIDSVVLDYMIVGEAKGDEGDLLEVLLVAGKRDMLNSFIEVISAAGLQVKDIDVSSLALQQVVPLFDRQDTVAVINIANQMSSILMTENGRPRFARITPTGLEAAAKTFNCSLEQVVTITAAGQPAWQQQAISSWSAALAEEISSSLSYYQNQQMGGAIKKIFIAGRGARIDGLAERLQENLGLTVAAIDPLEGITVTNKNIGITGVALDFTLSIALARQDWGYNLVSNYISLLPPETRFEQSSRRQLRLLLLGSGLMILVFLCIYGLLIYLTSQENLEVSRLQEQKAEIANKAAAYQQYGDLKAEVDSLEKLNADAAGLTPDWYYILAEVGSNIPDGVWLTDYTSIFVQEQVQQSARKRCRGEHGKRSRGKRYAEEEQQPEVSVAAPSLQGELTIQGKALSHKDVAILLENLHNVQGLDDIRCQFSTEEMLGERKIYGFEIKAALPVEKGGE